MALRRILGNLIENALRYSQAQVELRLDCDYRAAVIFVLDRGPGIPEAEREAVFRPFYRLERSRNRRTGGSGLGLAVARQLAVANNMEIHLSSRVGGGTVASVRLPPEEEPPDDEALAEDDGAAPSVAPRGSAAAGRLAAAAHTQGSRATGATGVPPASRY